MRKYTLFVMMGLLFAQIACEKAELPPYELTSKLNIYKDGISNGRDSTIFSFALKEPHVQLDTLLLPVRIMGSIAAVDRKISYSVIADSTDAPAGSYALLPSIVPANSHEGELRIEVRRTEALKTVENRLWIQLTNSEDFEPGAKELQTYLFKINDFLSKPASWDEIRFGEYSQVKYGLIIRETGYADFSQLHPEVLIFIAGTCRNALATYQEEHGEELMDERGLPVRFP